MSEPTGQRDAPSSPTASSPCVQICVIHPEAKLCVGCLRTADEIARWGRMTEAERQALMAELPARQPLLARRRGGRGRTRKAPEAP